MRQRPSGFTLIELMIVITIIAIIAAIAVPNLLRAKMAANEVATVSVMKAIATAQETFKKQSKDWVYPGHTTGVEEYANRFYRLQQPTLGDVKAYINEVVAQADVTYSYGVPVPHNGYFFCDVDFLRAGAGGAWVPVDHRVRYGIYAAPAEYNLSGLQSYYLDSRGQVWSMDTGDETLRFAMYEIPSEIGFHVSSE